MADPLNPESPKPSPSPPPTPAKAPAQPPSQHTQPQTQPQHSLRIRVLSLERSARELWIKLDAQTSIPSYARGQIRPLSRSYSDCISLHGALTTRHPAVVVPALPVDQASTPSDDEEERIVRASLQHWFDRIVNQPDLATDDELRSFLESAFGYSTDARPRQKRSSGSGSAFPSFRRSSSQDSADELGTAKYSVLKLESSLLSTVRSVENDSKHRKALSTNLRSFSDALSSYSTTESHRQSATALKRLAATLARIADVEARRAVSNMVTLGDTFLYEASEAQEAKDALDRRQSILDEHRTATKTTIAKKRNMERLKHSSSIRADKSTEAIEEHEEAARIERSLSEKVRDLSSKLGPSLNLHAKQMNSDIVAALSAHSQAALAREKAILNDLEGVLPELKNINLNTVKSSSSGNVVFADDSKQQHQRNDSTQQSKGANEYIQGDDTSGRNGEQQQQNVPDEPLNVSVVTKDQVPSTSSSNPASPTTISSPTKFKDSQAPLSRERQESDVASPPANMSTSVATMTSSNSPKSFQSRPRVDGQGRLTTDPQTQSMFLPQQQQQQQQQQHEQEKKQHDGRAVRSPLEQSVRSTSSLPPSQPLSSSTPNSPESSSAKASPQRNQQQQQQRKSLSASTSFLPPPDFNENRQQITDERQRVDAKIAASKLANLF